MTPATSDAQGEKFGPTPQTSSMQTGTAQARRRPVRRSAQQRAADADRWAQARRAGHSVEEIAADASVASSTVSRATYDTTRQEADPFPLEQSLDARQRRRAAADARTAGWIAERRRGVPAAEIAARDGVTVAWVRARTRPAGPFPAAPTAAQLARKNSRGRGIDPEVVKEWVRRRQAGETVGAIAATADVRPATVSAATSPHGPFLSRTTTLPGLVGLRGIARIAGVSRPAVTHWLRTGRLPAPAQETPRRVWHEADARAWVAARRRDSQRRDDA